MSIHFSPASMKRIREYQADLLRRYKSGQLSNQEAFDLLAARVRDEGEGVAQKVRCPDCAKVHTIVGKGQTFTCSTDKVYAVWDHRV